MNEPNKVSIMCRNGHEQQPNASSRFCTYCGTPLNNQSAVQSVSQPTTPATMPQQQVRQQNANPQFPPNQYAQPYQNPPFPVLPVNQCRTCGGSGERLDARVAVCRECRWLRPLAPGYAIDCAAFQWSEDGKAMSVLRSITPLTLAAQAISDKVGRRWIESTFNAVLLGEKQLPDVYAQAVLAGRILGMSHMPDVYVSGEIMWDCRTFGSDRDAFVIIGTSLAANFRGAELLFLFAREMGHCRAGHALWKTVIKFLLGEQMAHKGLMGNGLFGALGSFLSPTALVEGAIEMPLLAWARQAEITADRAGLLAVGDEEIARRVLLSWTLKSPFLYQRINVAAWLEQQAASDDGFTKLSELTTSSTPYITRRLKLMMEFARSQDVRRWQTIIESYVQRVAPVSQPPNAAISQNQTNQPNNNPPKPLPSKSPQADDDIRIKCSTCATPMRVPLKVLEGKQQISVRCPSASCGKMTVLKKKSNPASAGNKTPAPMPNNPKI